MERARHRKSKSASGIEGLQHILKQKVAARLSTDSRSYIDGSKRDDMFMLEFGQSPLRRAYGIPMKKLLAEEMSRDVEPKRRSPSVIARLMGFEGLPSPRLSHSQQKRLSEIYYQQKNDFVNARSKSQRRTDQQEFKDVYEDLEASHITNRRCSSRWSASSILTKPEMALIQQKLVDAKRLSTNEKLENHIAVLKPSNSEKYESKSKALRSERDNISKSLKREDGLLLEPHSRHRAHHISFSPSRNEEKTLPTRIVVLKPNLEKKMKEYPSPSRNVGLSKPISNEAREIAREITTKMRDVGCDEARGYDASGSESEGFESCCRKSFEENNVRVNREAKKRLSDRWKMTHKYQNLEHGVSKGRTLGEMLAISDRSNHSNGKTSSSVGISSKDGWADEIITKSSSRSKSVTPSTSRSSKRSTYRDENVKRSLSHEEDYSALSRYMKARGKKPCPSEGVSDDEVDSLSEANFEIRMEANIKELSEKRSVFQMCVKEEKSKSPVVDVAMIAETGTQKQPCLQELHEIPCKQASPSLPPNRESSESYKETVEHPSPISVLHVPFPEDTSSSESFDRVSAELQELRLKLQLLKMESNAGADVATLFPIGEEEENETLPSPVVSEGNNEADWEYSYAHDVLIASGLQESIDFNIFTASWYSPDCPLDPNLFDDLEKRSNDQTTTTISERRLLFDRINYAVLQIYVEHFDSCPWVMPKLTGCDLRREKRGVREAVEKLIDREVSGFEVSEKVVDREMQWWGVKGEIEEMGNEIEKVLIDEMIDEVVVLCNMYVS
ncbi:hypothetical protein CASFOL_027634 [Castilleja foliolosa]|uniref:DUF4378 domain-containing protein n=1 Tax=Castilleja foliolosa TaxID=1961234 RepID=A0ABD3CFD3_9LAMI